MVGFTVRSDVLVAFAAAVALAGCASAPEVPPAPLLTVENDARARLYADCAAEAREPGGAVARTGPYVRLTCAGPAARRFYDAMATFAAARGWETADGPATVRRITVRTWDDHCRSDPAAGVSCRINIPVGAFLDPARDTTPATKAELED